MLLILLLNYPIQGLRYFRMTLLRLMHIQHAAECGGQLHWRKLETFLINFNTIFKSTSKQNP